MEAHLKSENSYLAVSNNQEEEHCTIKMYMNGTKMRTNGTHMRTTQAHYSVAPDEGEKV
jgi:hypothetical protein